MSIQKADCHKMIKKHTFFSKNSIICAVFLFILGCVPAQKPSQTIINYTDNSIQLCGDNNQITSEIAAQQNATPIQTTEETTKDEMWKFWLIVLIIAGVGLYIYQKKRVL